MIRLQIANRSGLITGEIKAEIGPISWRLNDIGRVQFRISRTDEKATQAFLQFGNRLLVQFDNGLPDWAGVIDLPRTWEKGLITCNAYSGEYILGQRQTGKNRRFDGDPTGTIFASLITEANSIEDTGIEVGALDIFGGGHSPEYHFGNLLKICKESLCTRLTSGDFDITPVIESGRLVFYANLYSRRGADKSATVQLMEGHNIGEVKLIEQGQIINWWDTAAQGSTWGDERITTNKRDRVSISTYGLRQSSAIFGDISNDGTLETNTENLLEESRSPHNLFELYALDMAPAAFGSYDVGDSIGLQLYSYGFGGINTSVRVLAREFIPERGACKLVVEEELP